MSDVAVVTAAFGGIDDPHPQAEQDTDADWYYVIDGLETPDQRHPPLVVPEPWRVLGAGVVDDPRMAAKSWRMIPWHYLERWKPYRYIVWLDSSMEVTSPTFLTEALASAACTGAPLTAWKHPRRDCVYDEAEWSLIEAPEKYWPIRYELTDQVSQYRDVGYPEHHGLYATGTLVWNMEREPTRWLGEAWLEECRRTTVQDQVSLPVVAWRLAVKIGTFPVEQVPKRKPRRLDPFAASSPPPPYIQNEWLRIWPHRRND